MSNVICKINKECDCKCGKEKYREWEKGWVQVLRQE